MSWLRKVSLVASLAIMASNSGCCLFSSCAAGKFGCGSVHPGGALESYYQGGCATPSCVDGPAIPCRGGSPGCGLGLGCIGKLLGLAHAGCVGCGETYYHSWVNDPPCCDPCDSCGNWTGGPAVGCSGCNGAECDQCGLGGTSYEVTCGLEPGCGLAAGCDPCGRTAFQLPGRAIYATWTGVVDLVHEFRRGFLPSCHRCNSFSLTSACNSCTTVPSCDCAGMVDFDSQGIGAGAACTSCVQAAGVPQGTMAQATGRLPHHVIRTEMQLNHSRSPHRVVSNRLQQLRR